MRKFMAKDLELKTQGMGRNPKSRFIKSVARGMMRQGVALDRFLKANNHDHYVRLSIHAHRPESDKFAVDLYKSVHGDSVNDSFIRTPWHNCVCSCVCVSVCVCVCVC